MQDEFLTEIVTSSSVWDRILKESDQSSVFHTWAWRSFLEKQGLEPSYLCVSDSSGDVLGACPFMKVKREGSPTTLESLPESLVAGPLIKDSSKAELLVAGILRYIKDNAKKEGIAEVRIKTMDEGLHRALNFEGTRVLSGSGFWVLDLGERPVSRIWNEFQSHHGYQRTKIRRMEKEGIKFRLMTERSEVSHLQRLHEMVLDAHGTRKKGDSFYLDLWDSLYPDFFQVSIADQNGSVICAQAMFPHARTKTVFFAYFGIDKNLVGNRSVDLYLHWESIKWASENGFRYLLGPASADPDDRYRRYWSQFGPSFRPLYRIAFPASLVRSRAEGRIRTIWRSWGNRK
jgi:hypothetical protein